MRSGRSGFGRGLLVALVLAGGGSTTAEGANRRNFLFGGEAATTGGALIARTRGTDALFYNAAGLARTSSTSLNLSLTAFTFRTVEIEDGFVVRAGGRRFAEDLSISEILPTPSALVYARKLGPRWGYGFGVFIVQSTDRRLSARIEEPDELGLSAGLDETGSSKTYNIGGGLGWQATPELRLGTSLFFVYDRTISFGQVFTALRGEDSSQFLVNASQDLKNAGFQTGLSLQWEIAPVWTLGFALRSPVVSVYTWGDVSSLATTGDDTEQFLGEEVSRVSEFNVQVVDATSAELMTVVDIGAWSVGATVELSPPLDQGGLLPRTFDALVNFRLGAQRAWSKYTKLGFGFFTDMAPSDTVDDLLVTSVDYFGWTVGFQTARPLNPKRTIFFTSAFALGYTVGFGEIGTARLDLDNPDGAFEIVPQSATFHELALNLASGIEF